MLGRWEQMINLSNLDGLVDAIFKKMEKKANAKKSIICKVLTPPPNITLQYENIKIPTEQIYVANYLLQNYHRQYKIDGIIDKIEVKVDEYSSDNTTSTETAANHTHAIKKLSGSGTFKGSGTYQSHKDFWFTDTLIPGSEVLVELVNNSYVVVAQIVRMPSGAKEGA